MIDLSKPVLLRDNLWWVGTDDIHDGLQCNSYLMVHEGNGILFEPGNAGTGKVVLEKVLSIIPIENLEAIVLSHQDPDLCMAVPFFEKAGFDGVLCCHERAAMIIIYYGFKSPFYLVNHHDYRYMMRSGYALEFLFTPYLHFPGSIMTYLKEHQALISGDVFGSISMDWTLFADEHYMDGFVAFHEEYMPSQSILEDAMRTISRQPISIICPQHGSVIDNDIDLYIETLRNLPCGLFLEARKKKSVSLKGEVTRALNKVLARLITVHGVEDVRQLFRGSGITINMKKEKITKSTFPEKTIWHTFFSIVEENRGATYLFPLTPFVERICEDYELPLPPVFSSLLVASEQEIAKGREALKAAEEKLKSLESSLYRDPITQLYNQQFYYAYLKEELVEVNSGKKELALCLLSIDNLDRINLDYGNAEGDKTMRILADLLIQTIPEGVQVARLSGGMFGLIGSGVSKVDAIERGNALRNKIAGEDRFIVPITASLGMFHSDELPSFHSEQVEEMVTMMNQSAMFRLQLAKKQGGGEIIYTSECRTSSRTAMTILVVDNPGFNRDLIADALEKERYNVRVADDGLEAKQMINEDSPDLVLSELMIPKLSGITLRKELLSSASLGSIPFILMSINKNEQTIKRAYELQIEHFLRRPVALYEIVGLIHLMIERRD